MAITKTIIVDKTEVVSLGSTYSSDEYKNVQVRTATIIKEDGVELSRAFHRHVLSPGTIADGSTTLTSKMAVGDVVSIVIMITAHASGFAAQLTIDGGAVTEKWNGTSWSEIVDKNVNAGSAMAGDSPAGAGFVFGGSGSGSPQHSGSTEQFTSPVISTVTFTVS